MQHELSLPVFLHAPLASLSRFWWYDSLACSSSYFSLLISWACSRITLSLCLNNSWRCLYWSRYSVWDLDILLGQEVTRLAETERGGDGDSRRGGVVVEYFCQFGDVFVGRMSNSITIVWILSGTHTRQKLWSKTWTQHQAGPTINRTANTPKTHCRCCHAAEEGSGGEEHCPRGQP